jgi:hypothetical protein
MRRFDPNLFEFVIFGDEVSSFSSFKLLLINDKDS